MRKPVPDEEAARRAQRRAKREERRAKQRLANVGRAKKMHAARRVTTQLPAKSPAQSQRRQSTCPTATPELFIGCSGWFYWHWRGVFYPSTLSTNQWFSHYANRFGTVELNAPFYSWPTLATVQAWITQAKRRNFVYTVKVSELITHVKRFIGTKTLVQDFGYIADLLGPRMGCFLFQLPPSFHYTPARLTRIVSQLDPLRRNVVEFRHRSWWNQNVYAALRARNIIFCSCSGPRLPDELIQTADDIYIRFHGTRQWYRHDYTDDELATWAARIHGSKAKRVWAYFNNDRDGHAIKNARSLLRRLRHAAGLATSHC